MRSVMPPCTGALTVPGPPEQGATRIVFFIAGLSVAAWAPLVPFAKARTGVGDGVLGLLLLCLGAGSILSMPLAGTLAARFGCRRVLILSTGIICMCLPLLATASGKPLLMAALFIFGAGVGSLDCVVNIQAVIVERASRRPMMSGFHGLFSVGGIVGSGGVSALLSMGASPLTSTLCVAVSILGALVKAVPHLLPYGGERKGSVFAIPRWVSVVHRHPLLRGLPDRGCRARLECRIPDFDAQCRAGLCGNRLCRVRPNHDRRSAHG